jgi:epoxyqueuosine reductase QueG
MRKQQPIIQEEGGAMDRRTFIKAMGALGVVTAAGISRPSVTSAKTVQEPTYKKFIVGEIPKYDATNNVFSRMSYDPDFLKLRALQGENMKDLVKADKPGHGLMEMSLRGASWAVAYSVNNVGGVYSWGGEGLYSWSPLGRFPFSPAGIKKLDVTDRDGITKWVKTAGRHFGAGLTGITEINRTWVYSHVYNNLTKKTTPVEIPPDYKYAVVMAIELDYKLMKQSPKLAAAAATGLGYSNMAVVAVSMAEFIRNLGYKAIPMGNDTALSIPLAVDAGLGELGRSGMLITEQYGPRVRLAKVFTDLPLVPDKPIDIGVQEFCESCGQCARECPGKAISAGKRTTEPASVSNNKGGMLKWPLNAYNCFKNWAEMGVDCTHCMAVCPKNQPPSNTV